MYHGGADVKRSSGSRHGHVLQAAAQFLRACRAEPGLVSARDNLDRANSQLVDRWHFTMLNDAGRNAAFGRAVRAAVGRLRDGEVVLDVGAGTGLLSMLAARAGASPVYACESSEAMCQVASATLADNGMAQHVHLINKWSHQMTVGEDLPQRASLLVTETFDAGLLGEHILSTLQHAWRHLLLPPGQGRGHGRVLPNSAAVWTAAVESSELRGQLTGHLPSGRPVRRTMTEPYWSERLDDMPGGHKLLSEPVQVYSVDFNDPEDIERGLSGIEAHHVIRCTVSGRLDALVTWFELQLGEGERLSSAPGQGRCWEQAVYPVPVGGSVRAGEKVVIRSLCKGHLELWLDGTKVEAIDLDSVTSGTSETATDAGKLPMSVTEQDSETTKASNSAEAAASHHHTKIAEVSESGHVEAAVTDCGGPKEVSQEALAFINNRHQIRALESALRRWLAERPHNPQPRILDLCPFPLSRVMDLGDVIVTRVTPSASGSTSGHQPDSQRRRAPAEAIDRDARCGSLAEAMDRVGSLGAAFSGAGGENGVRDRGGSWDAVLCAPVLPSGRLDPAVLKTVQSVCLSEGGLLTPGRLQLLAVAVSSRLLLQMTSVRRENTEGLDCSAISVFTVHQLQDFPYSQQTVSSDRTDIHIISCLDLATGSVNPPRFSLPVTSAGDMHGLVYWFRPADGSGASRPMGGRQMAAVLPAPRVVRVGGFVTGTVHPTEDGVFVMLEE